MLYLTETWLKDTTEDIYNLENYRLCQNFAISKPEGVLSWALWQNVFGSAGFLRKWDNVQRGATEYLFFPRFSFSTATLSPTAPLLLCTTSIATTCHNFGDAVKTFSCLKTHSGEKSNKCNQCENQCENALHFYSHQCSVPPQWSSTCAATTRHNFCDAVKSFSPPSHPPAPEHCCSR